MPSLIWPGAYSRYYSDEYLSNMELRQNGGLNRQPVHRKLHRCCFFSEARVLSSGKVAHQG